MSDGRSHPAFRRAARRPGFGLGAILAAIALMLFAAPAAFSGQSESERLPLLREALADFDRGTALARSHPEDSAAAYREAAGKFEALVAGGLHNGKLYYNLGNTYLQLGEVGRAIINYRRAERLLGHDPQLVANLNYARSLTNGVAPAGSTQVLRTVFFWHYETSWRTRYVVAIVAYVLFWAVLILRRLWRPAGTGIAAGALAALWLAAGASAAVEWRQRQTERPGVLIASEVVVRKGNGEAYEPQFEEALDEGVEFILLEERPGWLKIELPDGHTGWIRADQAALL
jgi:tetratricopeptide (TPR) repeat protein